MKLQIIQYPKGGPMKIYGGHLYQINNYNIIHSVKTDHGSSGSPIILLLRDFKIIGIHKCFAKKINLNLGTYINYIIEYIHKNDKNEIICEYNIEKDDIMKEIQILNFNNNIFSLLFKNNLEKYCDLYLNDEKIEFCWKYKFKKEGKYKIKIISKRLLNDMSCMFYYCSSLTSLDLSNFITINVKNMSYMFSDCSSLTSINLSNFNTKNTNDMSFMFYNCSSLTSINMSNFNTINVTNMNSMFYNCSSLTSLDLSNFNTKYVNTMFCMFYNCSSLTSLDLSNFITFNVTNMSLMFYNCSSLTSLDLSNFNTISVYKMSHMFGNCSSLSEINTNDSSLFYCLKKELSFLHFNRMGYFKFE